MSEPPCEPEDRPGKCRSSESGNQDRFIAFRSLIPSGRLARRVFLFPVSQLSERNRVCQWNRVVCVNPADRSEWLCRVARGNRMIAVA